jgi:hypothetical protein
VGSNLDAKLYRFVGFDSMLEQWDVDWVTARLLTEYQIDTLTTGIVPMTPYYTNVKVANWSDPPSVSLDIPSRINPLPGASHKMIVAGAHPHPQAFGGWIQFKCIVDGETEVLSDADLDDLGFYVWWAELPVPGSVPILQPYVGYSSIVNALAPWPGHYCLGIAHKGGGKVLIHFDRTA